MKSVTAAIVGTGRVAQQHINAYHANGIDVVALCGRDIHSVRNKAKGWCPNAQCYDSVEKMVEKETDCSLVTVASPPELHAKHAITIAKSGKHMVIEKPVALNYVELEKMIEAVNESRVTTMVSFVLRWNELVQNIQETFYPMIAPAHHIETAYLHGSFHGKQHLIHEYGTRAEPIGSFIGGGCHAVDMAQHLLGFDIVSVSAVSSSPSQKLLRTLAVLAEFENGAIGTITASDNIFMPYQFKIEIRGLGGSINLNKMYSHKIRGSSEIIIPGQVPDSGAVWHHPFTEMIKEFVECARDNRETSCSLRNSYTTHAACFAAEESVRKNGLRINI